MDAWASSERTPALGLVLVVALLDMMAMGLVMPVLPLLIEQLSGTVESAAIWTGAIATLWAVMQFFCGPLLGALSDSFGRRSVILISTGGQSLSWVIMALAPNLTWLVIGRLIGGATSASGAAIFAYLADVTPPERRTRAFGLAGAAISAGFVVGPALGGLLGENNPALPFWLAALMTGSAGAWGWLVLPESLPEDRRTQFVWRNSNPLAALGSLRTSAGLARLALSNFLLTFTHRIYMSVFVLYAADRFGMGMGTVGLLLAGSSVLDLFVQGVAVGHVAKRFGDRATMVGGLIMGAVGLAVMAFANSTIVFLSGMVVNCAWGLSEPTMRSLMSSRVSEAAQGQLQGVMHCILSLAGIVGPLFFAAIYAASAREMPGLVLLVASAIVLAAAVSGAEQSAAERA